MKPTQKLIAGLFAAMTLTACGGGSAEPAPSAFPGLTVQDKAAYLASNLHLYKFDAATGAEAWRFPKNEDIGKGVGPFAGHPLKIKDQVIVGGATGATGSFDKHLYAISDSTGAEVWRFSGGGREFVDGAVTDGKLIFAANGDGTLYALDPEKKNGTEPAVAWTFKTENKLWSRPLVANGAVYQASLDHKLYALDAATGKPIWDAPFQAGAPIASVPALKDGVLYFGAFDSRFYAINAKDGSSKWAAPLTTDGWVWCDPVIDGTTAYFGDVRGKFYAVDINSGAIKWTSQASDAIRAQPLINNNTIYVVSMDTYTYQFSTTPTIDDKGVVASSSAILNDKLGKRMLSAPVLIDGQLLVPLFDGDVKVARINVSTKGQEPLFPIPAPTATPTAK